MEKNLVDEAYRAISMRIADGVYAPGSKLSIKEISESLNISRTPVSFAINRLIAIDVLEMPTQKGAYVKPYSIKTGLENVEIRQALELAIVDKVIERRLFLSAELEKLEELAKQYEEHVVQESHVSFPYENEFHLQYIKMGGSERMLNIYSSVMNYNYFGYINTVRNTPAEVMKQVVQQHKDYAAAIRNGSAEDLKNVILSHYNTSRSISEWYATL